MRQFRRPAALIRGTWLGASVVVDAAITQNFRTIDRFLSARRNVSAPIALGKAGRDEARALLRRSAAEENNRIFIIRERIGGVPGGLLLQKLLPGLSVALPLTMAVRHFALTPQITDPGRRLDDLPPDDPKARTFRAPRGTYPGLGVVKLAAGPGARWRGAMKRKSDAATFVRESQEVAAGIRKPGSA